MRKRGIHETNEYVGELIHSIHERMGALSGAIMAKTVRQFFYIALYHQTGLYN